MRATAADPRGRLERKFGLTRRLFERGYTRRRLGALSKEDEQRVRSFSVTLLDRLADDLLDFAEPADLQRWFVRYVM
jgi:hypothetical protein